MVGQAQLQYEEEERERLDEAKELRRQGHSLDCAAGIVWGGIDHCTCTPVNWKGAESWEEWEIEEADNIKKVKELQRKGYTLHCSCRIVWGDGICTCTPVNWKGEEKR